MTTSILGDGEVATVLGIDPTRIVYREDLVENMRELLWPEATHKLKDGPWDGVYRQLSQAEIDDLISFWHARKEPFPYTEEAWDCDNFALEFFYLAQAWNMRIPAYFHPPPPVVGIALIHVDGFYELFSQTAWAKFSHAINVIQRDDGQWLFFEPQNGRMIPIESPILGGDIEVVKIIL